MSRTQPPTLVARQGDVGIFAHPDLAATVRVPPDTDGSIVLARGEVTGHRHRFAPGSEVTLRVVDGDTLAERMLLDIGPGGAVLVHEEHAPVAVAPGTYEARIQRRYQYGASTRVED